MNAQVLFREEETNALEEEIDALNPERPQAIPQAEPALSHPILVIEDDPDSREGLIDLLSVLGYAVLCADNGQEALNLLQSGPLPCLILLDLMMPVMDGWEFRRRQLEDPRFSQIPVVVVSALGERDEMKKHPDLVPLIMLPKPIDPNALLEVIDLFCSPDDSAHHIAEENA